MATCRKPARVDVAELKKRLVKRLGWQKASKYFLHLTRMLNLKLTKMEFDRLCYATIGRENIALHNSLIRGIISNALAGVPPPSRQAATGQSGTTTASSVQCGGVVLPKAWNAGAVVDSDDGELARERAVVGKVLSVEDGEEVEQVRSAPCVQSRSLITTPLGVSIAGSGGLRMRRLDDPMVSCYDSGHLLDTGSLCEGLQRRLNDDGIGVTVQGVDALNHGLDEFLRRLIKPCMDLSRVRSSGRRISKSNGNFAARVSGLQQPNHGDWTTLQDFAVVVRSDPHLLGTNWPTQIEKIQTISFGE